MKVRELIEILQRCDPEAVVIQNGYATGREEVTSVQRLEVGGLETRSYYQYVRAVEIDSGHVPHMRAQGMDVEGHWPSDDKRVDFEDRERAEKEIDAIEALRVEQVEE
jgi:hypothetical protein